MKLNQKLSWEFTLPFGIILWLLGKLLGAESIIASTIATAGLIIGLLGIVDLIRSFIQKGKRSQ